MLDLQHLIGTTQGDLQVFGGSASALGNGWKVWNKPRGIGMVAIHVTGAGGNGGNGAVGAVSAAASGGGGGSGGSTYIIYPAFLLPDRLYISVGYGGSAAGARVSVAPDTTAANALVTAAAGGNAGNASGATGGTAGATANAASVASMPLGFIAGMAAAIAGNAGSGGVVGAPGAKPIPSGGEWTVSGNSGGGVPAIGVVGNAGGGVNTPTFLASIVPNSAGGSTTTTPGVHGGNGLDALYPDLMYPICGGGGGSSHGSATGAGLFGGNGGAGGTGCGGGGGGGCLTGGTAGVGGRGGDGRVVIYAW